MKENFFQKFNTTNDKQRFLYNEKLGHKISIKEEIFKHKYITEEKFNF